ncbi:MAG: formate dehydrogenase [Hylemonella sp.]|nr:formate dehydrogenase [Hylemonella sp.]
MSQAQGKLSRRTLFAGAGAAGAVAAVASLMTAAKPTEQAAPEPKAAPAKGGGYHLSEHVKHYYQTTRI